MLLMIDNYDSFTYNLVQYLSEIGQEVEVVRNDKICEAVDRIFNDFSGTSDFQKSISYLISSPSIDANKSYQCGDVGLELLLQ